MFVFESIDLIMIFHPEIEIAFIHYFVISMHSDWLLKSSHHFIKIKRIIVTTFLVELWLLLNFVLRTFVFIIDHDFLDCKVHSIWISGIQNSLVHICRWYNLSNTFSSFNRFSKHTNKIICSYVKAICFIVHEFWENVFQTFVPFNRASVFQEVLILSSDVVLEHLLGVVDLAAHCVKHVMRWNFLDFLFDIWYYFIGIVALFERNADCKSCFDTPVFLKWLTKYKLQNVMVLLLFNLLFFVLFDLLKSIWFNLFEWVERFCSLCQDPSCM